MQSILDWFKSTFSTVKTFFNSNTLLFLLFVSAVIILFFYVVSRIFTSNDFNKRVGNKFKRLNIIIRENQINEDREKFLIKFNKEVSKKNKTFSPVWDSFLKNPESIASQTFEEARIKPKKVSFFNFYLFFSLVVSFCALAVVLSVKKFILDGDKAVYIWVFVPLFTVLFAGLFNVLYTKVKQKQAKKFFEHFLFFTQNIDDAVNGFVKNDFRLSGGAKVIENKLDSTNVLSYEEFKNTGESTVSEEDEKHLQELAQIKVAQEMAQESLDKVESTLLSAEENNDEIDSANEENVEQEQLVEDEEETINPTEEDEIKQQLLESLEKLKDVGTIKPIDKDIEENNIESEEQEEIETNKEDDVVDMSLSELIKAKKERMIDKAMGVKKPSKTVKVAKTVTKKPKEKTINQALNELLEATKKSRIKPKQD